MTITPINQINLPGSISPMWMSYIFLQQYFIQAVNQKFLEIHPSLHITRLQPFISVSNLMSQCTIIYLFIFSLLYSLF